MGLPEVLGFEIEAVFDVGYFGGDLVEFVFEVFSDQVTSPRALDFNSHSV